MLKLAERNTSPPGGKFPFTDPDTKIAFTGFSVSIVAKQVRLHRVSNKLAPIENLEAVIEDSICQKMPPGVCVGMDGAKVIGTRMYYRSAESSVRATTLIRAIARRSKRNPTSSTVAQKRATICAGCKLNIPSAGCMSCRGVRSIVESMTRGLTTTHDEQLMACRVDGVLLRALVWIDDKTISETTGNIADYPGSCWKLISAKQGGQYVRSIEGSKPESQVDRVEVERRADSTRRQHAVRAPRKNVVFHGVRPGGKKKCCGG